MKARGIRCASQQLREEEAALRGDSSADDGACSGGSCSSCTVASCDGPDRGGFPVGASPCPGPVRQPVPLRRLLFCPFVGRFWRKAASSRPVASVLAPVFVFMKFAGRVVGYGTRPGPPQRTKSYEYIPANLARGRLLKTRTPADRTGCSGGKSRRARPGPLFIVALWPGPFRVRIFVPERGFLKDFYYYCTFLNTRLL